MLKFIVIVFILGFLFMKVMGLLLRTIGGSHASAQKRAYSHQQYQKPPPPRDGNVHIDYVPEKGKKSADRFRGGEYVDYEEVE